MARFYAKCLFTNFAHLFNGFSLFDVMALLTAKYSFHTFYVARRFVELFAAVVTDYFHTLNTRTLNQLQTTV